MSDRTDRDTAPATPRQVSYLASLATIAHPAPARQLAQLLDQVPGVELTDEEKAGHFTIASASTLISRLKATAEKTDRPSLKRLATTTDQLEQLADY